MKKKGYKASAVIAGDGACKEELKTYVSTLKLNNEIEFLGWVQNQNDFFSKIDVFCLTSTEETFGIVLLDAMKHKIPIVTTKKRLSISLYPHPANREIQSNRRTS